MELVVETNIQLRCVHGEIYPHADPSNVRASCYPPQSVESNLLIWPSQEPEDQRWLVEALDRLADEQVDMVQIMARRI